MKKPPKFDEIDKLLRKASEDEVILTKHLDDSDVSDAIWGFHAQQSIEKILKAVLIFFEIEFPKIHDLSALSEYFTVKNIDLPFGVDGLESLAPYAVAMRYDEDIETAIDRQEMYRFVCKIRKWAKTIIQSK